MIRPRQAVQQASTAIPRDQPGFRQAPHGRLGPAQQAVAKRLELADDIRPRRTEQQRVNEPAAIRDPREM